MRKDKLPVYDGIYQHKGFQTVDVPGLNGQCVRASWDGSVGVYGYIILVGLGPCWSEGECAYDIIIDVKCHIGISVRTSECIGEYTVYVYRGT